MSYLPSLQEAQQSRLVTDQFLGYDHNLRAADGTWFDEIGVGSGAYPLFAPRARRGSMTIGARDGAEIIAAINKDKLAWVDKVGDDVGLWYDGTRIDVPMTDGDKQLVSMGAYLCVFPDGVYFNTHDLKDCGTMGHTNEITGKVKLSMCSMDGEEYKLDGVPVSALEPKEPKNGDYWIDSSEKQHVLKKYSESSAQWVQFPTVYIRIEAQGIGMGFREQDAVKINGLHAWNAIPSVFDQVEQLNNEIILQKVEENAIVVIGVLDRATECEANKLTIERRVPVMDFVVELDNRLWGCRYGDDHGVTVNSIYACALGDCRNWYRYAGISTDSYAVQVGSDGPFTGMVAYGGYVLAWKENCVHRVYGTLPSNFTVTTTQCRGVAPGSGRSLVVVNEKLFYMSRNGVCVFDGSLPQSVFDVFAGRRFRDARAGVLGSEYIMCAYRDGIGGEAGKRRPEEAIMSGAEPYDTTDIPWEVWSFDSDHGIWHHLMDEPVKMFLPVLDELVYINGDGHPVSLTGRFGEKEGPVEFDAISGIIGYEYPDHKYLSRFVLRVKMAKGDLLEVLTKYDSDGEWISQGEVRMSNTGSFTLPVIPRRCDHMQIRLRGRGDIRVFSIAKVLEVGSDA